MIQTKWQKIEELFNAVFELSAEKRAEFLDSVCKDNELRSEVESLLKNAEKEDSFLGKPNFSLGLTVLSEEKKHLLIGKKIGRYQIIRLLGEGGMGEVYLAEDLQLNRQVALKLLPVYLVEDDESVTRFRKEALAASSISHPNIAHIYEAGIEGDHRFIAMEFVEGTTLRELIKQKKLDVVTALDIIWQTANALVSAHQAGIIHRDIKPENIMIRSDGYVKVLDFGIAKLAEPSASVQKTNVSSKGKSQQSASRNQQVTSPGLMMGTMGYISPEQLTNKKVDFRTDIWSLGVVLYEILSGNKPFRGKTPKEISKAILHNNPPLFSVSTINSNTEAALQKILTKTLDKKAADRFQSTSELSNELKELKQKLEFSQQFSTSEIKGETSLPNSDIFDKTQNSSFITKSKLFWNHQSLSRKALLLAVCIGVLTFAVGVSFQYFSRFYTNKTSKLESFSPDSRNRWQSSILFGMRLKAGGFIGSYSFSPDGKAIAFHLASGGKDSIYIRRFNEADAKKITNDVGKFQTPVWSPDGKHIAFVTIRDNKNGIWTIPADGGEAKLKTPLSISTSYCELLKWSNDGKKMFLKSALALKTIDVETGQIENIDLPREKLAGVYSISPDESVIAFLTIDGDKQQIWAYNLKTRELNDVTDESNEQLRPAVLPDNKRLIYSSNQNGSYQLYSTDFVSKKSTQLTFSDSNASDPLVSPDGRNIVYLSENRYANIFAADVKTKKRGKNNRGNKNADLPRFIKRWNELGVSGNR